MNEWANHRLFICDCLKALAVSLRLSRVVVPYMKDKKNYHTFLIHVIKSNLKDEVIIYPALQALKSMLCNPEAVGIIAQAYPSLQILLLQAVNQN